MAIQEGNHCLVMLEGPFFSPFVASISCLDTRRRVFHHSTKRFFFFFGPYRPQRKQKQQNNRYNNNIKPAQVLCSRENGIIDGVKCIQLGKCLCARHLLPKSAHEVQQSSL